MKCHTTCGRYSEERNPRGIKFAFPNHYLVHGWIPAECIIVTYSQNQFRDICGSKDNKEGMPSHRLKFQERIDKLALVLDNILLTPPHALLQNGDKEFEDEPTYPASGLDRMHLHSNSTQMGGS